VLDVAQLQALLAETFNVVSATAGRAGEGDLN
jgi:hypothetical protein